MSIGSIIANFKAFLPADFVDILIVAIVIYKLLGFINKSRAGQLAKGALFILVLYALAYIFDLRTVTWIMENSMESAEEIVSIICKIYS